MPSPHVPPGATLTAWSPAQGFERNDLLFGSDKEALFSVLVGGPEPQLLTPSCSFSPTVPLSAFSPGFLLPGAQLSWSPLRVSPKYPGVLAWGPG